jgi:hypothetical protein
VPARIVTIVTGVWLMFAPAVLGYGDPAAANDRLVGPTVASIAFVAVWEVVRPVRWAALPFGVWLVAAPVVLSYGQIEPTVSSVVSGVVVLASTPPGRIDPARFAGGWRAVWSREPSG